MTKRRALVINHEPDVPSGHVGKRLEQRGFTITDHQVTETMDAPNVAAPFPDFSEFDLVVILGSFYSLARKEEIDTWVYEELELIRKAHNSGQPVWGICFGAQAIADALGGSVEESPVTEMGWLELEGTDALNPAGNGPWMVWHHDRFHAPPQATVLAKTPIATHMFTMGKTLATQFHPEVDSEVIGRWLSSCSDEHLATYGNNRQDMAADAVANEARNIEQCHNLVDWFLDEVAFAGEL